MGAQGEAGGPVVRQHFLRHPRRRQLHTVVEIAGGLALLVVQQGPRGLQGHDLPLGLVAVAADGLEGVRVRQGLHVAPVQGGPLAQLADLPEGAPPARLHDAPGALSGSAP